MIKLVVEFTVSSLFFIRPHRSTNQILWFFLFFCSACKWSTIEICSGVPMWALEEVWPAFSPLFLVIAMEEHFPPHTESIPDVCCVQKEGSEVVIFEWAPGWISSWFACGMLTWWSYDGKEGNSTPYITERRNYSWSIFLFRSFDLLSFLLYYVNWIGVCGEGRCGGGGFKHCDGCVSQTPNSHIVQ